jgi:hypothetical protein
MCVTVLRSAPNSDPRNMQMTTTAALPISMVYPQPRLLIGPRPRQGPSLARLPLPDGRPVRAFRMCRRCYDLRCPKIAPAKAIARTHAAIRIAPRIDASASLAPMTPSMNITGAITSQFAVSRGIVNRDTLLGLTRSLVG